MAVVCSIQYFWRILSSIFQYMTIQLQKREEIYKKEAWKAAARAADERGCQSTECSLAMPCCCSLRTSEKSEEQSRLQNKQKRNFTFKKYSWTVKQVSFEDQLAQDISYIREHQVCQNAGGIRCMERKHSDPKTTAWISQWQLPGKFSGVQWVQFQYVCANSQSKPKWTLDWPLMKVILK